MSEPKAKGWISRLKAGLSKSASSLSSGVTALFTNKRRLDASTLEELEDVLIMSDLGVNTASAVTERLSASRYDKGIEPAEVRAALAEVITETLTPVAIPLPSHPEKKPYIMLMVGVNGTGKTTTIGKLASQYIAGGKSVMLAAADTFRAAAIDQLKIWGERSGASVVASDVGADPASVAFKALEAAKAQGTDIVMIDTAGRLQNKQGLMDELAKIIRVIRNLDEDAPHATVLVLDATTGQNAINQVEVFRDVADITGLIMTKLDGTARGGVLVACAEKFGLPVHAIGVGEGIDDLHPFEADQFAQALIGESA